MRKLDKQKDFARVIEPFLDPRMRSCFDPNKFHIKGSYIYEYTEDGSPLSDAFLDVMFPRTAAPADLFHYTPLDRLASIADEGALRLYSMEPRIHQGELKAFAEDHGLEGYLDNSDGEPYYKELANDLFYTSFTPDTANESEMWGSFSRGGPCVRLKFRLDPKYAELRSIQYAKPSRTALVCLNEQLKAEGLPPFVPRTISKIGAFYLQSDLSVENEVRLLLKRHLRGRNNAMRDSYEYWPIKIGEANDVCNIELLEVTAGPGCDPSAVAKALANTALQSVRAS
jgi:hypothetical protein